MPAKPAGLIEAEGGDMVTYKLRWGFRSKKQLPLFMIWREEWYHGEVVYAWVLFDSRDWIGC